MKIDSDLAIAFAVSGLLHVAGLALLPLPGGSAGSGASGADRVTVAATPAIMVTLESWDPTPEAAPEVATDTARPHAPAEDSPVEVALREDRMPERPATVPPVAQETDAAAFTVPEVPAAPAIASLTVASLVNPVSAVTATWAPGPASDPTPIRPEVLSTLALAATEALPEADAPPAPPDRAPVTVDRPKRKPAAEPVEAVTRKIAAGEGIGATRGGSATDAVAQVSASARQSAQSAWAAEIQRRIARHQAYPRGSQDEGKVRVAMVILSSGQLDKVSVVTSSGAPLLDQAALQAVRRAAPFPPAPKELTDRWFKVGQWIAFERR